MCTTCLQLTIRTAWKTLQKKLCNVTLTFGINQKGKYGFRTMEKRKTQNFVILHSNRVSEGKRRKEGSRMLTSTEWLPSARGNMKGRA